MPARAEAVRAVSMGTKRFDDARYAARSGLYHL